MRTLINKLEEKIATLSEYGNTDYDRGYIKALGDCITWIDEAADDLVVIGNIYYVIEYRNGRSYMPEISKMKLYQIRGESRKVYFFSRNLEANILNTALPDIKINGKNMLRRRVFFTYEHAKDAIENGL